MQKYFYISFRTKGDGIEWRILMVIECLQIISYTQDKWS